MSDKTLTHSEEKLTPPQAFVKPKRFLGFLWKVSLATILRWRSRDILFIGLKLSEHVFLGLIYDDPVFDRTQISKRGKDVATGGLAQNS